MDLKDLQKIQKLIEDLRIEQYLGLSIEVMDVKLHSIEIELFKLMDRLSGDKTSNDASELPIPDVSGSLYRRQLAKEILIALLSNPERYKYIAEQVESGKLKQEEANLKNINKAYKIADSFLSVGANPLMGSQEFAPYYEKLIKSIKQ